MELEKQKIDDAQADAWYLLEFAAGMNRTDYLMHAEDPVSPVLEENYKLLIRRRASHIPLQQITGTQEFMGLCFQVNEHVLIPRQDTEVLVSEVLRRIPYGAHVLDLCTGSGCIAVSLAVLGKSLHVTASDISLEALAVAGKNGKRLGAEIDWRQGDLYDAVPGMKFDWIVSNPPYIRTGEIETLQEEVRLHEPHLALDGDMDGLAFYRRIIGRSEEFLNPGGSLALEIGYDQGTSAEDLMKAAGFEEICRIRDLAGLDRVIIGKKKDTGE